MINEAKIHAMYKTDLNEHDARIATSAYKDGFDAALDLVARILDVTGEIGYTADTKSGNKIRIRLDSP